MTINIKLVGLFQTGRFSQADRDYPIGTIVQTIVTDLRLPQQHFGIVLINGVHADINAVLAEGDLLTLMPVVDGG